jgi:hypothetical protein
MMAAPRDKKNAKRKRKKQGMLQEIHAKQTRSRDLRSLLNSFKALTIVYG